MMLVNHTVTDFIDRLASGNPTPGGGSAAALGGTIAAALTEMVCNLTLDKEKYAEVQQEIAKVKGICQLHRHRLLELVDEDAHAFDQVMAAFKMPKGEGRLTAIQTGYKLAASVPLVTAEECLAVLQQATNIACIGNKNSITDAGTAAQMAFAALHSALLNVEINISAINDLNYVRQMRVTINDMKAQAQQKLSETQSLVHEAL